MILIAFFAALISFLAYLGEAFIFIWLHIRASQYSPIKQAVSDYGVGKTKSLFNLYLHLNNLGTFGFVIALITGFESLKISPYTILFLFLLIGARTGLALFPTDLEGKARTRTGALHYIFAVLVFGLLYITIYELTPLLGFELLNILSTITMYSLIAVVMTTWKPLRKVFGLFERIFIVVSTLWFLIASAFLAICFIR